MNAQTYLLYTGSFATLVSILLVQAKLRNRQLRILQKKSAEETATRIASLEKANEIKSNFLTTLSHEIRNPLNGIAGLAESMNATVLDGKNRQKLDWLRQCSSHLSSLLDDVLDFSQVQPDAFKANPSAFDLFELTHSVAIIASAESEKRGLPIQIAISPATPRHIVGDALRIRQILLNYVYNALKYSSRGKIDLTVWHNHVSDGSAEISFAVSDDGPGIDPGEQIKLFEPLDCATESISTRVPRKALGLSICKMLAQKINGTVWVESEVGQGSVFYFKAAFPVVNSPAKVADLISTPPLNDYKTALVVDDEEYNRVALSGLLETLGLRVFAASHDRQAFELATLHDLDLVFVDYSIPGLNGAAIARELRKLPGPSRNAAIFATTAFNTPEIRTTCLAAGMDAFLTKPITSYHLRLALGAIALKDKSAHSPGSPVTTPLANLRLLAAKKGIPFSEEIKLYFAEFETEFSHLHAALEKEDAGKAAYYAHLLYGRCSFISERSLEAKLRKIEFTAATGRWDEAHGTIPEVARELTELKLRLYSAGPVARPE